MAKARNKKNRNTYVYVQRKHYWNSFDNTANLISVVEYGLTVLYIYISVVYFEQKNKTNFSVLVKSKTTEKKNNSVLYVMQGKLVKYIVHMFTAEAIWR